MALPTDPVTPMLLETIIEAIEGELAHARLGLKHGELPTVETCASRICRLSEKARKVCAEELNAEHAKG